MQNLWEEEVEKMSELPDWAKWVARDENGKLWAYKTKPEKWKHHWHRKDIFAEWNFTKETDGTYAHVKWTDEHPTRVTQETGFPRLDNELTESTWPTAEGATRILHPNLTGIDLERIKPESVSNIEPQHYRNPNSKYVDKYDQWYHEHDLATFRAIMRAIAERYITRYENKNGIEDLEKGIYTLTRLKEYEEQNK